MTYTFSADPEFFVRLGNEAIPSHICGVPPKKEKQKAEERWGASLQTPNLRASESQKYGAFYRDGATVELSMSPRYCRAQACGNLGDILRHVRQALSPHTLAALSTAPITFPPDTPLDVQEFGCEPSLSAYAEGPQVPAGLGPEHPKRFAGGHLHLVTCRNPMLSGPVIPTPIPYSSPPKFFTMEDVMKLLMKASPSGGFHTLDAHQNTGSMMTILHEAPFWSRIYVRMLDYYLGLPFTYLYPTKATFERREFYGKAGEYRLQTYNGDPDALGLEYRTPGSEIFSTPYLIQLGWGVMRSVLQNFLIHYTNSATPWKNKAFLTKIRRAINTGEGLEELMKNHPGVPGYYDLVALNRFKKEYPPTEEGTIHFDLWDRDLHSGWGERFLPAMKVGGVVSSYTPPSSLTHERGLEHIPYYKKRFEKKMKASQVFKPHPDGRRILVHSWGKKGEPLEGFIIPHHHFTKRFDNIPSLLSGIVDQEVFRWSAEKEKKMEGEKKVKLFVYGTLKDALPGKKLEDDSIPASAGYTLCGSSMGHYPWMWKNTINFPLPSTEIHGQTWEIPEASLKNLDAYEGTPNLFKRIRLTTTKGHEVWVYVGSKESFGGIPFAYYKEGVWSREAKLTSTGY